MAAGASLVKMGFFMSPIVTGNLPRTTAWQPDFLGTVSSADGAARRDGVALPSQNGKRSACPTITLLHSENPTTPHNRRHHGWVAQLAEQWTENPRVGGSIPPPATPPFSLVKYEGKRVFFGFGSDWTGNERK